MKKFNYIGNFNKYTMLIAHVRFLVSFKRLLLLLLLSALPLIEAKAQDNFIEEKAVTSFAFDQIPVLVKIEGYGDFYVDVIYTNSDLIYINVVDLFKTLNIPCVGDQNGNSIEGFIEKESNTYIIDYSKQNIRVGSKIVNASNGLVKESAMLYMELSLFAEAFGITMTFNYHALTLKLKSDFELPVIKQQRLERMRSNLSKLRGEIIADTVVHRNYHLFKFGTLDWLIASNQAWKGSTDNRFGLGIGTELLYGEADVSVNYYDKQKFDNRQLYYLWRWVDNDKSLIKQAQLGRISNQTIAFINSPMIGAVIRNSPTTVRKATGYYTISESTEPNWTVELYINDVLVDFIKADASGLYTFKVPLVYGYTTLKFKFYGPLGEERTEERTMNIPYTFMPAKEFEYSLSAGIVQDCSSSRFGKAEFNYGVNRILTVGGGVEYLSSISNGAIIPYAKATIQPYSKLTLTGEYAHGVKSRGLIDYYFMKNAFLEIDYNKYLEGQLATRFNASEERKVKLSIPFRYKMITSYAKIDFTQLVYKSFYYNQGNIILSAYYKQFSANSSTQLNWIGKGTPCVTTDLALSYRMRKGYTIRPSAQYNVSERNLMLYKIVVEKNIARCYLSAAYERNVLFNDNSISFCFKYDLSFARTNVTVSHNRGNENFYESAQGSLAFGSGNKYVYASNNTSVSKGGISLHPFLDLNQNGKFDVGEHMVKLGSVRVMGSKVIYNEKDSIVRIPDLNAFTNCIVEFSDNDLENISWRFKRKIYKVLVDPNQFKRIDIPIISVGEASGMVYINKDNSLKGIGRILVKFYKKNSIKVVAETLSESDGYIYYIGLEPGEYVARLDSTQLSSLDFTVEPKQIDFTIKTLEDGDIVSGADFVLNSTTNKEAQKTEVLPQTSIDKDVNKFDKVKHSNNEIIKSTPENHTVIDSFKILKNMNSTDRNIENDIVWGMKCTQPGNYYVQCGAFKYKSNAMRLALYIKQSTDMAVGVVLYNGFYKVQVECVSTMVEANELKNGLRVHLANDSLFIMVQQDSVDIINPVQRNQIEKDSTAGLKNTLPIDQDQTDKLVWGIICSQAGNYYVECGVFRQERNAMKLAMYIKNIISMKVGILLTKGFYKVQIECVPTRAEAEKIRDKLIARCLNDNAFYD